MLIFTAVVAGVLCIAVKLPELLQFAALFTVILLVGDYVTSARHPRVASISWILFGVISCAFAASGWRYVLTDGDLSATQMLIGILIFCIPAIYGILCFVMAKKNVRKRGRNRTSVQSRIADVGH